jgi:hypothetical protein
VTRKTEQQKLDEAIAKIRNPAPGVTLVSHGFVKAEPSRADPIALIGELRDALHAYHAGNPWPPKRDKDQDAALLARAAAVTK